MTCMIEEERIKTEKFKLEVKEKREGWIRLEEWYNRWEEELRVKDKELGKLCLQSSSLLDQR